MKATTISVSEKDVQAVALAAASQRTIKAQAARIADLEREVQALRAMLPATEDASAFPTRSTDLQTLAERAQLRAVWREVSDQELAAPSRHFWLRLPFRGHPTRA